MFAVHTTPEEFKDTTILTYNLYLTYNTYIAFIRMRSKRFTSIVL